MSALDKARAIARTLEADILLGRLHPRERLVEDRLAARFDTKRHVVREALAELDRAGLVIRAPARGAAVRELMVEEVNHLYEMREIVEGEAARRIPLPLRGEPRAQVARLCDAYAEAVERSDMEAVIEANKAFHRALFRLCGNPLLADTVDRMAQKANLVRFSSSSDPDYLLQAAEEHRRIAAALDGEDPERLATLCLAHIQPSRRRYLERRERSARRGASGTAPSERETEDHV